MYHHKYFRNCSPLSPQAGRGAQLLDDTVFVALQRLDPARPGALPGIDGILPAPVQEKRLLAAVQAAGRVLLIHIEGCARQYAPGPCRRFKTVAERPGLAEAEG